MYVALQLFSDNVCSFTALRNHGMKVKSSKCTLFCSSKVKLYGIIVDLESGKLYPEER
jgi:hypothetical protein